MQIKHLYILILALLAASCSKQVLPDYSSQGPSEWITAKVAVVLPLSGEDNDKGRYERIWKMFDENVLKAQYVQKEGIRLELEWFDENKENITALANKLYDRDDIKAVIGPLRDENIEVMAKILSKSEMPMFVMTSSEGIIRRFSSGSAGVSVKKPFLWSISETDIVLSQIILAKAGTMGVKNVSVISADSRYGDTFDTWIPYYANEMRLDMVDRVRYSDANQLRNEMDRICRSQTEVVVCALNGAEDVKTVMEVVKSHGDDAPKVYFTGSALSTSLFKYANLVEGAEGFSPYSSPYTGFHLAYQVRFGEYPMPAEAQLYDAFLLSLISFAYSHHSGREMTMNEALARLSDLPLSDNQDFHQSLFWETTTPVWDYAGLRDVVLNPLRNGRQPELNLVGAIGNLKFAPDSYTSLVKSTYMNWVVNDGRAVALDFIDENGIKLSSYIGAWQWKVTLEELENGSDFEYVPSVSDRNLALLICGSEGWYNYRHQADILYVYQTLKANGYTDADIILIMRDDIAYHPANKYPGVIKVAPDGENLYRDVVIDYRADTLCVKDIEDIIVGNKSDRLSTVLESTAEDNVLLYWTGHGTNKSFSWLETGEKFTDVMMGQAVRRIYEDGKYKSMLICTEPCFSGSVINAIEGIPLVLGITAANNDESSFAENYSEALRVWMCDRFTYNLIRTFTDNPYITLLDAFMTLNTSTIGSHVQLYNTDMFYYLGDCMLWDYFRNF